MIEVVVILAAVVAAVLALVGSLGGIRRHTQNLLSIRPGHRGTRTDVGHKVSAAAMVEMKPDVLCKHIAAKQAPGPVCFCKWEHNWVAMLGGECMGEPGLVCV